MPRKVLKLETKKSIMTCLEKFLEKNGKTCTKTDTVKTVAEIFSVSPAEVFKILKEGKENLKASGTGGNKTPTDKFLNYCFRKDLQKRIWDLNRKNEFFTIDTILAYAKEELEYEGGRTTLWKIIKDMGYKHKMVNGRKILCEKNHVISAKIKFLRKYLQYKNSSDKFIFVFIDETWIYQNGSAVRQWVHDFDTKSTPSPSVIKSEGKRFTILHAGCTEGFLTGCDYLLDSKNNDHDYHKTMTGDIFKTWTELQLLPALSKLDRKCVVVMDNAPYHSMRLDKPPIISSSKKQLQEWLTQHNITFDQKLSKQELYDIIKPFNQNEKKYVIDDILQRNGHEVLRLPPYHCQYNPIEMAWGFCKTQYNEYLNSLLSSKDKFANLWLESISKCTSNFWKNYIRHTDKIILDDWTKLMGECNINDIPPVILTLGESDSESEDFSCDTELDFESSNNMEDESECLE